MTPVMVNRIVMTETGMMLLFVPNKNKILMTKGWPRNCDYP